jgi:bifunctional DNase/RNase
MEVEMTIRGLMLDPVTQTPIVILKDVGGDSVLPIWVGVPEANAIALEMEKVSTPRPMTHDLIKNVLTGLETQVHKVVVTELREDTFYAVIWLERGGDVISIDSRPSDALALALRVDCPIFVEEIVLKTSKLAANSSDRLTAEERQMARGTERRGSGEVQDVGEGERRASGVRMRRLRMLNWAILCLCTLHNTCYRTLHLSSA